MSNTFCTIITANYYPYALALYKSLRKQDPDVLLQVLVTDDNPVQQHDTDQTGINIIPVSRLQTYSIVNSLYRKYAHIHMDSFRWSLKPVFIRYLLEHGFEKVLFTDCDIFFFNDYHFLFNDLNESDVLLTPHWHNSNPLTDPNSYSYLITRGMFNAGFIGANRKGIPPLQWWAEACHFKMGPTKEFGWLDDQRYLDVLPVKFENVKIIRHRGCNLSAGNDEECKRELINGQVLINGQYPVVFIHFNPSVVKEILKGHDPLLLPYFNQFKEVFEENGSLLGNFMKGLDAHLEPNKIIQLKWKLKLRTRIKQALHKLSQKL